MKGLSKILLALTGVAALSIAYPASVQAVPTTYTYTGNHFTNVSGLYTTSDFLTATITLAGPLGANENFTQVTPIVFKLSDGVQTITQAESPPASHPSYSQRTHPASSRIGTSTCLP